MSLPILLFLLVKGITPVGDCHDTKKPWWLRYGYKHVVYGTVDERHKPHSGYRIGAFVGCYVSCLSWYGVCTCTVWEVRIPRVVGFQRNGIKR